MSTELIIALIKSNIVLAVLLTNTILLIWLERKLVAGMQSRVGPDRAGPFGILQTVADAIKLLLDVSLSIGVAEYFPINGEFNPGVFGEFNDDVFNDVLLLLLFLRMEDGDVDNCCIALLFVRFVSAEEELSHLLSFNPLINGVLIELCNFRIALQRVSL